MKNNTAEILKGLEFLAREHFQTLKPSKNGCTIQRLETKGYQDLFFTLKALLNVCILALEHKDFSNSTTIYQPESHVQTVLELAVQLIPFEEGAFLDQIMEGFFERKATACT